MCFTITRHFNVTLATNKCLAMTSYLNATLATNKREIMILRFSGEQNYATFKNVFTVNRFNKIMLHLKNIIQ
jgi:hypothetical protein